MVQMMKGHMTCLNVTANKWGSQYPDPGHIPRGAFLATLLDDCLGALHCFLLMSNNSKRVYLLSPSYCSKHIAYFQLFNLCISSHHPSERDSLIISSC